MDVDKLRISCLMHSAYYLLLYFNICAMLIVVQGQVSKFRLSLCG